MLPVGTKSVLFGVHQPLIHGVMVLSAYTRLYGFPRELPVILSCFTHDIGYLGKRDMDGPEGETHVIAGAKLAARLFDPQLLAQPDSLYITPHNTVMRASDGPIPTGSVLLGQWGLFNLLHSRFYAKQVGLSPSKLCVADKLVIGIEPWWLYLPRAWASGELWEYIDARLEADSKYDGEPETGNYPVSVAEMWQRPISTYQKVRYWHARVSDYCRAWAYAHKDGQADTWTQAKTRPQPGTLN